MINSDYLKNIPDPKKNVLHEISNQNLTTLSFNPRSENEFSNLLLNSNLEQSGVIK